ncbi:hypothetical protein J2I47_19440 [Fibrella sp. HMF5335]|uniref:Uncharacterized protein n=1 Tax=Fibrella rubiginis TaxID=2817060 RepID=A0A939GGT9_9BACT|nr:hypothetical protein [Fibrella rubiginis]MBO0938734.1 hypothetical protein [Fibrella rubiginis]
MSVTDLKSGLHRLVDVVADEHLLTAVYTLLDNQASVERDFWHDLSPAQQADIQAGLADLDAGRIQPAKAVFARYQ